MNISLNGEARDVTGGTLAEILQECGFQGNFATAVNEVFVPAAQRAEQMVQDRGLNAVSFQDLADAVGLRKPSIFHHFRNKEELTLALIDRCATKHGPQYAEVIARDVSPPAKLRQIAKIFEDGLKNEQPCLMAALGGGMESLSEAASGDGGCRRARGSGVGYCYGERRTKRVPISTRRNFCPISIQGAAFR